MKSRYANPAAQLGGSVGGIVNAFLGSGANKAAGFNAGAKSQSDINLNNANIAKIMEELGRNKAATQFDPNELAMNQGAMQNDIGALDAFIASNGANYGQGTMPEGQMGPAPLMTERPEYFTPADEATIRNARSAKSMQTMSGMPTSVADLMATLEGGSKQSMLTNMQGAADTSVPANVRDIMSAIEGRKNEGSEGGAINWNDSASVGSMLSKGDMAHYLNAINEGKNPKQAIAAVVGYHTELNEKDIMPALMKLDPMMILETLGQNPGELGRIMAQAIANFKESYNKGGKPSGGGGKFTYVPGKGLVPN